MGERGGKYTMSKYWGGGKYILSKFFFFLGGRGGGGEGEGVAVYGNKVLTKKVNN